jgi:4-hydroxybenzoate polyprenyltransferase
VLWAIAYDTFYAMVDRDDDLRAGVKSSAILFGRYDRAVTAVLQAAAIALLAVAGRSLGAWYAAGLGLAAALAVYQQWLIRERNRELCFKAFLNNAWFGAAVFAGLALALG